MRYTDPTGMYFQECGDDYYGRCGTLSPVIYNIFICGISDGNNCGGSEAPLSPYYNWPGYNKYFDVDAYSSKKGTLDAILSELIRLPRHAKLRIIGHSAGADVGLLIVEKLLNSASHYSFDILAVVLLDTSLSGVNYKTVGGMIEIVDSLINAKTLTYIVTTAGYPIGSSKTVSEFLPPTDLKNNFNYYYRDLAKEDDYQKLTHKDLALNVDIALDIWSIVSRRK